MLMLAFVFIALRRNQHCVNYENTPSMMMYPYKKQPITGNDHHLPQLENEFVERDRLLNISIHMEQLEQLEQLEKPNQSVLMENLEMAKRILNVYDIGVIHILDGGLMRDW